MTLLRNKRRLCWFALLLGGVALIVLVLTAENPRAELLTQPPGGRQTRLAFLGRWSTPVRLAWQKMKFKLFGPVRSVSLTALIVELPDEPAPGRLGLPPLALSNHTTRVWLLNSNETAALRSWIKGTGLPFSLPNLWTADGRLAQMSIGGYPVQAGSRTGSGLLMLDVLPNAVGGETDLAAYVRATEAVTNRTTMLEETRTNLAAGARLQIPPGHSMFLITTNRTSERRLGLIVSPVVHEPGK